MTNNTVQSAINGLSFAGIRSFFAVSLSKCAPFRRLCRSRDIDTLPA